MNQSWIMIIGGTFSILFGLFAIAISPRVSKIEVSKNEYNPFPKKPPGYTYRTQFIGDEVIKSEGPMDGPFTETARYKDESKDCACESMVSIGKGGAGDLKTGGGKAPEFYEGMKK